MTKLTSSKALKFKTHTFIAQNRKSNKTIEKYNSYFFAWSDTHTEYTDFKRGKYKEDSSTLAFWTSNQFSKPWTLIVSSEKLFGQISSSSGSTGRRCKQSSSGQQVVLCLEHCSVLWTQWVHATHNSYRRLLNHDSSSDKFCKVVSRKARTSPAILAEAVFVGAEKGVLLFSKTLMNLFLQIRMRSQMVCVPMKSLAPLLYNWGACLRPCWEDQVMHLDKSWGKSPWGTKPSRKWRYSGHGSHSEGSISHRPEGDDLSWQGTKYLCSCSLAEDKQENLAINP